MAHQHDRANNNHAGRAQDDHRRAQCAVVAQSAVERIVLSGFKPANQVLFCEWWQPARRSRVASLPAQCE